MSNRLPEELCEVFSRKRWARTAGVKVRTYLDAVGLFKDVGAAMDKAQSRLLASDAKRILEKVRQWHRYQLKAAGDSVHYSDSSIESVCAVLILISKLFFREGITDSGGKRKQKPAQSPKMDFTIACSGVIVSLCRNSESAASWRYTLLYIQSASSLGGFSTDEILSSNSLGEMFHAIRNGLLQGIKEALEKGHVEEASMIWGSIQRYQSIRSHLQGQLSDLFERTGSVLPPASQEWLVGALSISLSKVHVEFANPAESPEIRQAASLLLFLWDNLKKSDVAREAFERFKGLSERHFQLFLRGDVGATMTYDSRFHETSSADSGPVVLVRPWIEWFSPPRSRIVLRGIVEPVR